MSPEHWRLTQALLLSLLIHTLLLSLTFGFGGEGLWLPGFGFPWSDRRVEAPDLRVAIVPAQVTTAEPAVPPAAEVLPQAPVEQPAAVKPAVTLSAPRRPAPRPTTAAIIPEARSRTEVNPNADVTTAAAPAPNALRGDRSGDAAPPPFHAPAVVAVERTDEATRIAPDTPATATPVIAAAPSVSSPDVAMPPLPDAGDSAPTRIEQQASERAVELAKLDALKQEEQRQAEQLEAAQQDAARQEAARADKARLEAARQLAELQEASRLEVERQEAARQEAAQAEAARAEVAQAEAARAEAARAEAARAEAERTEAARAEAARAEAARAEAARAEAARVEAARAEAARAEAARVEAARAEAARAEAARAEAARAEAARAEAARAEAARAEAAQEAAERREAALRAIGRQLDEEAARREAATAATRLLPSSSGARRYRLFGRADPNAELILYAEAWARKIQMNMTFDMVREALKQPHADPLVTVAIRSDGSVESVIFVHSSGVPALDEAIRRVVDSQKPYDAFPPGLAREYDVIEIRRTWYFDMAIRLY